MTRGLGYVKGGAPRVCRAFIRYPGGEIKRIETEKQAFVWDVNAGG